MQQVVYSYMAHLPILKHHCILGVRNCLVSKESGVVVVKIANIGMSREKNVTYKTSETPIRWTAPEVRL